MSGHDLTGSAATSFLFGIAVGAVESLALASVDALPNQGADMATNTTVLLIVVAMAALVLACVLAGVVYQTRAPMLGEKVRDRAEEDTLRLRRQELLADEFDARAHAAQVEIDIKTVRACSLQRQATVHRSEAVTSRDQLNRLWDSSDKLGAAAHTRELPPPVGFTTLHN